MTRLLREKPHESRVCWNLNERKQHTARAGTLVIKNCLRWGKFKIVFGSLDLQIRLDIVGCIPGFLWFFLRQFLMWPTAKKIVNLLGGYRKSCHRNQGSIVSTITCIFRIITKFFHANCRILQDQKVKTQKRKKTFIIPLNRYVHTLERVE